MAIFQCRTETPVPVAGHYLFPVPVNTHEQTVRDTKFLDCAPDGIVRGLDGTCEAFLLKLEAGQMPAVAIEFDESGPGLAPVHFEDRNTRFEQASVGLMRQIEGQFRDVELARRVPLMIQFIADHFYYAQRETHLGENDEAMPPLECGLMPGTCVDMHTLCVAALRALGVKAAYIMGCHIAEGREAWPTGHCWMNVQHEGVPHHWDISHHVQYGVRTITPALNPKPGRRFALSVGRGRRFEGRDGIVEFPSLSGFHALDGALKGQKLRTLGQFAG